MYMCMSDVHVHGHAHVASLYTLYRGHEGTRAKGGVHINSYIRGDLEPVATCTYTMYMYMQVVLTSFCHWSDIHVHVARHS